MKKYEVGGCVRDEILGVRSKDIDFTVVIEESDKVLDDPFVFMSQALIKEGFKVFVESPEFLTVRAKFPETKYLDSEERAYSGTTADFVLARKEGEYTDGRRPDRVEVGTLEDDLARRDFTMNAIAKAPDGILIDPFNGRADIDDCIIRAVGDPFERLTEDALRAVRAMRFAVTKGFGIDPATRIAMEDDVVLNNIVERISDERIQVELSKMFRFDTRTSVTILNSFPRLTDAMFAGSVSLDATMKLKGRG